MEKKSLLAYLEALGIELTMETFDDRKRMQKLSYLFPLFGLDIGLEVESYSWYLHGPYSPGLTRALFEIVENPSKVTSRPLTSEERSKIRKMRTFLGSDIYSIDSLELLVSLHFLLYHANRLGATEEDAISLLEEKKPYFKDSEIQQALSKVRLIL